MNNSNKECQIESFTILKTEPFSGSCCCCLSENSLKSLLMTYYFNGKSEIYSEMLYDCFSLQLVTSNQDCHESYLICDICISRLRDAYFFKSQVEAAQETIKGNSEIADDKIDVDAKINELNFYDSMDASFKDSFNSDSDDKTFNLKIKKLKSLKSIKKKIKKDKTSKKRKIASDLIYLNSDDLTHCIKEESIQNPTLKKRRNDKIPPFKLDKDAVTCEICNETFPIPNALLRHMPIHFPNHICHICARLFATKIQLKKHIRRHKQNPEVCEICKKTYKGKDNLRMHMRYHLNPDVVYKCPHCPERFSVYYKRMKHLVDVHNDEEKKYKCKQCPKKYNQAGTLKRHVRSVHLQEKNCICAVCGDAFFDKAGLKDHMLKHSGIKNFECDICHKSYGRHYTLIEHMKIHTNDKRFICPACGKAFTQKCTLKGHLKTHEKSSITLQTM